MKKNAPRGGDLARLACGGLQHLPHCHGDGTSGRWCGGGDEGRQGPVQGSRPVIFCDMDGGSMLRLFFKNDVII